jgi:hypothetical protein
VIAPGLYRHYKGGLYLVIGIAETHNHNGDIDVIYVSLTYGKLVTRAVRLARTGLLAGRRALACRRDYANAFHARDASAGGAL